MEEKSLVDTIFNRSVIIVKAKQPLFDWLNELYPQDQELSLKDSSSSVYLIKEIDELEDIENWLKENYQDIFYRELSSWHTLEEDYPRDINYLQFLEWFDYEIDASIIDLNYKEGLEVTLC